MVKILLLYPQYVHYFYYPLEFCTSGLKARINEGWCEERPDLENSTFYSYMNLGKLFAIIGSTLPAPILIEEQEKILCLLLPKLVLFILNCQ